jgi:two-component system response regulator AtoC
MLQSYNNNMPRESCYPHDVVTSSSDRTRSHYWDMPATGPRLVVLWDGGSIVRSLGAGASVVVGRGDECDVQVLHASVSRRHVQIAYGPGGLTVRDLGSANGTRIGGRLVLKSTEAAVAFGEAIEAGAAIIVVQPHPERVAQTSAASAASASAGAPMERVRELARLVAATAIPVLLLGETGVGKEITANAIHTSSPRAKQPFVRINCAALTESLLESEIFGHERGAFTGAVTSKPGLLEQADGGTLFLDEIGELSPGLQAKLLRVLEDREVRRVGATKGRPVDVRFIAATNRDLPGEVQRGAFRADLYFRLNGVSIRIPPLRERRDEIVPLADRLFGDAYARMQRPPMPLSPNVARALVEYSWPGNVRELRNVAERAVLLALGGLVDTHHLVFEEALSRPAPLFGATASGAALPADHAQSDIALPAQLERLERERVLRALDETGGNQTLAAKRLGITRRQLIGRIEAFGLPRPRKKGEPD